MASSVVHLEAKPLPGAEDHGEGLVSFALYAPGKRSVHLAGSFNDWRWQDDPLDDTGGGYWAIGKHLPAGRAEYQFVIDGKLTLCDPYAQEVIYEEDRRKPPRAVIDVSRPIYRWKHPDWRRPNQRDLIIYELHVGDFTPEGTFRGVIDKLDYLQDLGINAIEFMPLYETDPHGYWGYEPLYYLAARREFGSFQDLLELVDEAHARNIACILDLVLTHTGERHPFNQMYRYEDSPWYGRSMGEQNRFGMPMLDYTKDATNSFARDVQEYWLRVLHFDGFRYDYLLGLGQDDEGHGLPYLMKVTRAINPDAYLIGECVPEDPDLVNDSGLGAVWHSRCLAALKTLLLEEDTLPFKASDFQETVRAFLPETQGYTQDSFMINFAESHDEQRLLHLLKEKGFDDDTARAKSALAAAILMTIPGEPMLYHGQEFGEDTQRTLEPNKLHWEKLETPGGKGLHSFYKAMCHLRSSRTSLRDSEFKIVHANGDCRCLIYQHCYGEVDQVVVAVNFADHKQTCRVPFPEKGEWHDMYTGKIIKVDKEYDVEMDPHSAAIYLLGVS